MKHLLLGGLVAALCLGILPGAAQADSIQTFELDEADNGFSLPVHARATFEITGTTLEITLENLLVDQTSVNQALTGLYFSFTGGESSATLVSGTGDSIEVADDGTYTPDEAGADLGWPLINNAVDPLLGTTGLALDLLSSAGQKDYAILGSPNASDVYASANDSIAGNGPHNPFIQGSATFLLTISGLASDSVISGVTFQFNTAYGTYGTPVPEPASLTLMAAGLGLAGFVRRRRRQREA